MVFKHHVPVKIRQKVPQPVIKPSPRPAGMCGRCQVMSDMPDQSDTLGVTIVIGAHNSDRVFDPFHAAHTHGGKQDDLLFYHVRFHFGRQFGQRTNQPSGGLGIVSVNRGHAFSKMLKLLKLGPVCFVIPCEDVINQGACLKISFVHIEVRHGSCFRGSRPEHLESEFDLRILFC